MDWLKLVDKLSYKDYYWHIINQVSHNPTAKENNKTVCEYLMNSIKLKNKYVNEYLDRHFLQLEKPHFKHFNIKHESVYFVVILGYLVYQQVCNKMQLLWWYGQHSAFDIIHCENAKNLEAIGSNYIEKGSNKIFKLKKGSISYEIDWKWETKNIIFTKQEGKSQKQSFLKL